MLTKRTDAAVRARSYSAIDAPSSASTISTLFRYSSIIIIKTKSMLANRNSLSISTHHRTTTTTSIESYTIVTMFALSVRNEQFVDIKTAYMYERRRCGRKSIVDHYRRRTRWAIDGDVILFARGGGFVCNWRMNIVYMCVFLEQQLALIAHRSRCKDVLAMLERTIDPQMFNLPDYGAQVQANLASVDIGLPVPSLT